MIVLVSGAIANKPFNGGAAWTRLNYILGLQKLNFDVYFVEQIEPGNCVDGAGRPARFEESVNVSYFKNVMKQFGLANRAALICEDRTAGGMDVRRLGEIAGSAGFLLNISGHLQVDSLKSGPRVKAYLDLDPGYTQFWHVSGTSPRLAGHDYYFTVGENIGAKECQIPTDGIRWRPTRQPVVLEQWSVSSEGDPGRFTSVASWRGPFGPIQYGDTTLGAKVREFRKYISVPSMLNERFELALDIHPADHGDADLLRSNSWNIVDPRVVVPDPHAFRRYVQTSGAEFSVAQQIYVETRSGWFSDRSLRYLASGKPVLIEDTGFNRNYPTGNGLLSFSSVDDAVAGVRRITQNYADHARAARQIAETYFDSNRVLAHMLDQMEVCP